MAERKLDIFDLLGRIDDPRAGDIYEQLTEEQKKEFAPLVVMRWMSGTSDERQIMMLDSFVNPYVFSLGKHPHLLMQLLQTASSKTCKRYQWISTQLKVKNKLQKQVIGEYFDMSDREVGLLSPFPPAEEIVSMAEALGWQKDELAKLQKEIKG